MGLKNEMDYKLNDWKRWCSCESNTSRGFNSFCLRLPLMQS